MTDYFSIMILISVCNAGYYKSGSGCDPCSGKTIKPLKGDATDCDEDCDGVTEVPNAGHTACS